MTVPSPWQADSRFRDYSGEAWYQHKFDIPAEWLSPDRVVFIGFGAVDYFAEVWLDDIKVGEHEGGYLPLELDVTSAARAGTNTITVRVDDPLEIFAEIPHGKQSWYGMLSGIWQSVWAESRAARFSLRVERPLLWSPDEPNLYTLKVPTDADEITETFGFRAIEAPDGKILLNGRPFYPRPMKKNCLSCIISAHDLRCRTSHHRRKIKYVR